MRSVLFNVFIYSINIKLAQIKFEITLKPYKNANYKVEYLHQGSLNINKHSR